MVRWLLWAAVVGFSTLTLTAGEAAKDQQLLQGQWLITHLQEGDEKEPPDQIKDLFVVIKDERFTISKKDKVVLELSFKLDPDKKPKAIDFTVLSGEDKGQTEVGIYVIDGDTVKFCVNERGKKRPEEFISKLGDVPLNLVTLKRKS